MHTEQEPLMWSVSEMDLKWFKYKPLYIKNFTKISCCLQTQLLCTMQIQVVFEGEQGGGGQSKWKDGCEKLFGF